jgi:dipeptidyl aminopeptidase/acylaminoacyl peptidase
MNTDLVDAADWALKEGIAERDHIGIWGWSYGGYATLAALAFAPEMFACGMDMFSFADLETMVRSRPEPLRTHWRSQVGDDTTEAGRALLHSRSPIHFPEKFTKPLLVTHGAKDVNVPRSESDKLVAALQRHNARVTYLLYRDEGHDYQFPATYQSLFAIVERFFHQHLGGRFEPYGEDLRTSGLDVVAGADEIAELTAALRGL